MSGESEAANREVERSRVSQRVKWYVNACAWRIAQCLSTTGEPGPYADIFSKKGRNLPIFAREGGEELF